MWELICGLKACGNIHESLSELVSSGGGIPLLDYSKIDVLKSLSVSINFIEMWLKGLDSS